MELVPLYNPEEVSTIFQKELEYISEEERDPLLKQILREYYEFVNIFKKETDIEALF